MAGIKDIAKLAGVSIGTVDRVLHKRGRCAPETQAKVEAAIQALNYQPNIAARQLKKPNQYKIAIVQPEAKQDQGYWLHSQKAVEEVASESSRFGVELKINYFDRHNLSSFAKALSHVVKDQCSGVLIPPLLSKETLKFIEKHSEIEFVLYDCPLDNENVLQTVYQEGGVSGATVADLFCFKHNTDSKLAVIGYESAHILDRMDSFSETMINRGFEKPDIHMISDDLNFDECQAYIKESNINLDIYDGVFVAKTGVHKYARLLNMNKHSCTIVGFDVTDDNLRELQYGTIDFLISQSSRRQVKIGLQTLVDKLCFSKLPEEKVKYMPVDILTKHNSKIQLSF